MADFFSKETIKSLRKLRQLKPDLFKALMDWDDMIFRDGALPAKTKELMAVTAAHVTDCPWCIEEHVKRNSFWREGNQYVYQLRSPSCSAF